MNALTALALARSRETARLPQARSRGTDVVSNHGTGPRGSRPRDHRSDGRWRSKALRSRSPDVERHRALAGRLSPHHHPKEQEPDRAGESFSGHIGHIGMARRMVAAGAPNAAVQNQGRWKDGSMVARYTRGEAAGEALKWLT